MFPQIKRTRDFRTPDSEESSDYFRFVAFFQKNQKILDCREFGNLMFTNLFGHEISELPTVKNLQIISYFKCFSNKPKDSSLSGIRKSRVLLACSLKSKGHEISELPTVKNLQIISDFKRFLKKSKDSSLSGVRNLVSFVLFPQIKRTRDFRTPDSEESSDYFRF